MMAQAIDLVGSELADYATAEVARVIKSRWRRVRVALNMALCERALGISDVAFSSRASFQNKVGETGAIDLTDDVALESQFSPPELYGGGGDMTLVDPDAPCLAIPDAAPGATPRAPEPPTVAPARSGRRRSRTASFSEKPDSGVNPFDVDGGVGAARAAPDPDEEYTAAEVAEAERATFGESPREDPLLKMESSLCQHRSGRRRSRTRSFSDRPAEGDALYVEAS